MKFLLIVYLLGYDGVYLSDIKVIGRFTKELQCQATAKNLPLPLPNARIACVRELEI